MPVSIRTSAWGRIMTEAVASNKNARVRATRLFNEVLGGRGSLSDRMLAARDGLAGRDAAFLQALVFGALRHGPRLQWWLGQLLDKPLRRRDEAVGAVIMLGLYQLAYTRVPSHAAVSESVETARAMGFPRAAGLVNALLRRFEREKTAFIEASERNEPARWMHPAWLIEAFRKDWPDHWQDLLTAGNDSPPMVLRVNRRRRSRDEVLSALAEAGIAARPGKDSETAIWLSEPLPVERLPGFEAGDISVQDESAQLVADLLSPQPGHRVLDACAAPGGKTAHLLESSEDLSELVALDVDGARLRRVDENLVRLGLQATVQVGDASQPDFWWDGRPFDRILLDVPCSGSGVIRRHPDIKSLRRETDLVALTRTQSAILEAAWGMLAPGGQLLYTTCSLLREENQARIEAFLRRHPEARPHALDLPGGQAAGPGVQRLPAAEAGDGFFYASVVKP